MRFVGQRLKEGVERKFDKSAGFFGGFLDFFLCQKSLFFYDKG